jgi:hypothetical protein
MKTQSSKQLDKVCNLKKTVFLKILFFCAAFLFISADISSAEPYKPGSLGFLYENCRSALEQSDSPAALYETACGAFVEGYIAGFLAANWIKLSPPDAKDPCHDEKQDVYDRISGRFCPALPEFDKKNLNSQIVLENAADLVMRWIDFLKTKAGKSDPLKQPAAKALGAMLWPGDFCDSLGQAVLHEASAPAINPRLLRTDWKDFIELKEKAGIARKYEQCQNDLAAYAQDAEKFRASRCGAEVSGFLAGLQSTSQLQQQKPVSGKSCGREIDRLYRGLDVKETMCVSAETDPVTVAKVFIERMDAMTQGKGTWKQKLPDIQGFGAIGYETIYRGFMCAAVKQ